jgi:hypothetical protein
MNVPNSRGIHLPTTSKGSVVYGQVNPSPSISNTITSTLVPNLNILAGLNYNSSHNTSKAVSPMAAHNNQILNEVLQKVMQME